MTETYHVYRDGKKIASNVPEKTYTDTGLKPDTAYRYQVSAGNEQGESELSEELIVRTKAIAVSGVTIKPETASVEEGKTVQLQATVAPNDATNKQVSYTSSDDKVAVVNKDGLVTAVKPGEAQITVKTQDGNKIATSKITVTAKPVPVASVSVTPTTMELEEGKSQALKAAVKPDNADDKTVTFKSSDTSIATADAKGLVKAVKAGKATITATAKGDTSKTATCAVMVTAPPAPPPEKEEKGEKDGA